MYRLFILISLIILSIKSMIANQNKKELIHHPLFIDALFVPTEQLHVKLIQKSPSKHQIEEAIVIPCADQHVFLNEIQNILQSNIPQAHLSSIIAPQSPVKKSKIKQFNSQKETVRQIKKRTGKRKQTSLQLHYQTENLNFSKIMYQNPKNEENRQKYEICFINLLKKTDVFQVVLDWSESLNVQRLLVEQINKWYQCNLTQNEIEFYQLKINFGMTKAKSYVSFLLKKQTLLDKEKLSQLIFSPQTQAVYIGFDIITTGFNYKKPIKSLFTKENTINVGLMNSGLRNNQIQKIIQSQIQPLERILLIYYEDGTGMRLQYNQLKEYKVKYLLGMLCVPNYDKRGLIVFNKVYLPDQHVSDFQFQYNQGNDMNFLMAKITSQKKLFMDVIYRQLSFEKGFSFDGIFQIDPERKNSKQLCIYHYLNQAKYGSDNNQKGKFLSQIICEYIERYFVQIQCLETTVWKRYIKTMVQQLACFPVYQGEVYRVVDYECSAEQGEQIEFKNFIVTSRVQQNAKFKMKYNQKFQKTFFRIHSKRGRKVHINTDFKIQEVVFLPYTSFKVLRKTKKAKIFEIEMQEICQDQQIYRSNLLLWVDDKQQQGKKIFQTLKKIQMRYPIILIQLNSNSEFEKAFSTHFHLLNNNNIRKIVITNMTRPLNGQIGKLNQIAGVQTFKFVKQNLSDRKTRTLFYIGNLKVAEQKLIKNGVHPSQCDLVNNPQTLIQKLVNYCNWQEINSNQPQQKKQTLHQDKFNLVGKKAQEIKEKITQSKLVNLPQNNDYKVGSNLPQLPLYSKIKGVSPKISLVTQKKSESPVKQKGWGDMFSKLYP